ncbi:MAG: gliding motility-associated C-terminal domain-containing protein, partial [Flavobacteriales bacterium]|nr:gliding motility-associated C-terminal domain-containing protein [Flavobacteriales bacterium]
QSPFIYSWSTGGSGVTETFNSGDAGSYTLNVVDFCEHELDVAFDVIEPADIVWEVEEDQYCIGQFTEDLVSGGAMPLTYVYSEDSLDFAGDAQSWGGVYAGEYPVYVVDQCGQDHTFYLNFIQCDTWIPNVFSPDVSPGSNDTFQIHGLQGFPQSRLEIYNRWGNLIYEDDNYRNNWDGDGAAEGTYFYIFYRSDGKEYSGHFTLIRGK